MPKHNHDWRCQAIFDDGDGGTNVNNHCDLTFAQATAWLKKQSEFQHLRFAMLIPPGRCSGCGAKPHEGPVACCPDCDHGYGVTV